MAVMMMKFDKERMHRDILRRLNKIGKSQEYLADKLGMGRSTIWRLSKNKEISTDNFLKIVEWLDEPIMKYIKQ